MAAIPDVVKVERVDGLEIGDGPFQVGHVDILIQLPLVQEI
jgi:hypothetical protein